MDQDEDGYGDSNSILESCEAPAGYVDVAGDCDDIDNFSNPQAVEYCDGADNNCDGNIDEAGAVGSIDHYIDLDGDGFGDDTTQTSGCTVPTGSVLQGGDCDDNESTANPAALEVCDGIDNDCDGDVDESDDCEGDPTDDGT